MLSAHERLARYLEDEATRLLGKVRDRDDEWREREAAVLQGEAKDVRAAGLGEAPTSMLPAKMASPPDLWSRIAFHGARLAPPPAGRSLPQGFRPSPRPGR